ncbi:MAG: OmpH family outer membrane protein [Chlamydiae bacterium]|nr:OmpH family outer membrane protein [Chlamydiota bacterium]MBI3266180.1 OmpH family outer membrane protein [Chlamydiota bacterium]
MKKLAMVVAGLFFLSLFNKAWAEDLKIGYVDVEKVFNEYDLTKQNDAKLKEEGKGKTAERAKMVDEIKKLKEESELLNEEARKEKESVINEKINALKDFDEKTKSELRNKRDFLLKGIFDDIKATIEEIGKEGKYNLIFNDRALLYKTPTYDISAQVTKRMNEKAKAKAQGAKDKPAEAK